MYGSMSAAEGVANIPVRHAFIYSNGTDLALIEIKYKQVVKKVSIVRTTCNLL